MHAIDLLVRHWAEIAPIDAVDYCFTSLTEEYRFTPLRTALFVWARNDPVGAISWAEKNVLGKYRRSFFKALINGWALTDLDSATEYVRTMDVGVDRDTAIQAIAKSHLHYGVEAYEKWLFSLVNAADRKKALEFSARWVRWDQELSEMHGRLKARLASDGATEKTDERQDARTIKGAFERARHAPMVEQVE